MSARLTWIPAALTTLRLILGPVAIGVAATGLARGWFALILTLGLWSDILDGVLARRWGVSTPALRRYDSQTDVVFYLCILTATWLSARAVITPYLGGLALLLASEAACIGVSLGRFRRLPATHSYAAKFYGLCLFTAFLAILCQGGPAWVVPALIGVGLIANAEIIAILYLSRVAPVDVPTFVHAWRRRSPLHPH